MAVEITVAEIIDGAFYLVDDTILEDESWEFPFAAHWYMVA